MEKAKVISLYQLGISRRQISKLVGISRNTVSKYINDYLETMKSLNGTNDNVEIARLQEQMFGNNKMKVGERPKTKFEGKLKERFEYFVRRDFERDILIPNNKQQVTAVEIHRQLIKEGFDIGESTIRGYLREYKEKFPEVFIRQEYNFGQRMEFDFHQIKVLIGGEEKVYHQATMSFPRSNHVVAYLFKDEKFVSIMEALVTAFREIEGVPERVVFDNLRPVVSKFLYGSSKEYTKNIMKLSSYYGFEVFSCNPRSGNEKGHVENSGKVLRKEMFSLKYEFKNEQELYDYFKKELNEHNKKSEVLWEMEKSFLKPCPKQDYVIAEIGEGLVNPYSLICVDKNYYSVNERYVSKRVEYLIIKDDIVISYNGEVIGKHKKVDGSNQYRIDINHYLNTFLKKPKALPNSLALKQSKKELQTIYNNYYIDNPRGFILFLMGKSTDELSIKSIEDVSMKQLNSLSEIFGQA